MLNLTPRVPANDAELEQLLRDSIVAARISREMQAEHEREQRELEEQRAEPNR